MPFANERAERMEREVRQVGVRMDLHRDLARAVDQLGGPGAVSALGTATANRAYHSHLAWELKVPISTVEAVSAHRVVFRLWRVLSAGRVYTTGRARMRRTVLQVGDWRVVPAPGDHLSACPRSGFAARRRFTSNLQGVNNPPRDG